MQISEIEITVTIDGVKATFKVTKDVDRFMQSKVRICDAVLDIINIYKEKQLTNG